MKKDFFIPAQSYAQASSQLSDIQSSYWKHIFEDREEPTSYQSRWQAEKASLLLISTGNVAAAEARIRTANMEGLSMPLGLMSESALHEARYALIAGISLYTRTALEAGLPEVVAYNISDSYIRQIDKNNDPVSIFTLMLAALREFCQAVQDWSYRACSPSIRICCEYIMTNLHQPITCQDLSDVCHLNPNYMSDLFYKELHIRPMAYVRQQKLKHAHFLLSNSTLPVAAIANQFAFPSPSAFSVYFQKEYGMTPTQFRKGIKKSP